MSVFLDDIALNLEAESFGAVLDVAKEQLAPEGRIVVEVQLDGQTLSSEEIEEQQESPLGDKELRLISADPRQLAVEALEHVGARLNEATGMQDEAAELLQQDDSVAALGKLGEAIEIWLQVQQAVLRSAALVEVDMDQLAVEGKPVAALTEQLLTQLQALKELIETTDTVGLADVLAYEWPALVAQWSKLIAALIRKIKTP